MYPVLLEATSISTGLTNFGTVLSTVAGIITDNAIMMTMFCGGLLVVGAKVFKRIKNAVK